MSNLKTFIFNQKEVRTTLIHDEPYFCLKDVCEILDIKNRSDVVSRLNAKGVDSTDTLTNGGMQKATFINESNLYKVIFQSRKEEAERFTDYVTGTILPSIRKHGAYMTGQTLEEALTNPDFLIKLATELKAEQEKRREMESQNSRLKVDNQIMQPKAEYFDELVDRNLLTGIRETAKELKVKEKEFVAFLLDKKYLFRNKRGKLEPYAQKNTGLFEVKECMNEKTNWSGTQTLITPKGRETFRILLSE